ncbi:hypothetical protein HYE68_000912 [Fusarium pseudograminearum]|nr:hypothetical protein HYE68_000912 [Fusarium pseudograminearum]
MNPLRRIWHTAAHSLSRPPMGAIPMNRSFPSFQMAMMSSYEKLRSEALEAQREVQRIRQESTGGTVLPQRHCRKPYGVLPMPISRS